MPKMLKPLPMRLPMHPSDKLRKLLYCIALFLRKSPGVIQGFFVGRSHLQRMYFDQQL